MYKPKNDSLDPQQPCPVCGGQEFEWGRLAGQVYYIPGFSLWRGKGRQVIKIRRCLQCNNLLQFSDEQLTRQQTRAAMIAVVVVLLIVGTAVCFPLLLTTLFTR
jgi:hypothetical protein